MKFGEGMHISQLAEKYKGSLDDVYIIPAQREWGHLLYTLYKTTALKDDEHPERKHGVVVVINHAPGNDARARAAQTENAKLYKLVAALNSPFTIGTHTKTERRTTERSGNRFDKMVQSIQKSGVPIIPVYLVEEGMSVAIARHEGGKVARPLLKTDTGLLLTLDAETVPDEVSLQSVRRAFKRFPIDVAAMQVLYDMHSIHAEEYAPYLHKVHNNYLHETVRNMDDWLAQLKEKVIEKKRHTPESKKERKPLLPIIQTAGAGTALTGGAYDILQGWMRIAGKQIGEDVDIGHRAVRAGLNVRDFHDSFVDEFGKEVMIPAIHWTTPRSGGRAAGQAQELMRYQTGSFADFESISPIALRMEQALYAVLAHYHKAHDTVPAYVPDDVLKVLEDLNVSQERIHVLWQKFVTWDGVHHTQGHHDVILEIRKVVHEYKRIPIRDYVISVDSLCRKASNVMNSTVLFGEPFNFSAACFEWDYDNFMRAATDTVSFYTKELPPSHTSEDFSLKHRIIMMREYSSLINHVYIATLKTFTHVVSQQIRMEQGVLPNNAEAMARAQADAAEEVRQMKVQHSIYMVAALRNIVAHVYDAHYYSDAGAVQESVWKYWKALQIHVAPEEPHER